MANDQHAVLLHPVAQARKSLGGIGQTKFYELVNAGRIRTVKIGTRTLVPESELQRLVGELLAEAKDDQAA